MSTIIEPKFIAFLQVSFDKNWQAPSDDRLYPHERKIMWHMAKLRANKDKATVSVLDMSYKLHQIQFREAASVGIGNTVIYFDSQNVIDTKVTEAPPEYTVPSMSNEDMQ